MFRRRMRPEEAQGPSLLATGTHVARGGGEFGILGPFRTLPDLSRYGLKELVLPHSSEEWNDAPRKGEMHQKLKSACRGAEGTLELSLVSCPCVTILPAPACRALCPHHCIPCYHYMTPHVLGRLWVWRSYFGSSLLSWEEHCAPPRKFILSRQTGCQPGPWLTRGPVTPTCPCPRGSQMSLLWGWSSVLLGLQGVQAPGQIIRSERVWGSLGSRVGGS